MKIEPESVAVWMVDSYATNLIPGECMLVSITMEWDATQGFSKFFSQSKVYKRG